MHHAVFENLLFVIHVFKEHVQRLHALYHAGLNLVPVGCADDARHQVEGENLLGAARIGIHGEGDTLIEHGEVGRMLQAFHTVHTLCLEMPHRLPVDGTQLVGGSIGFVERRGSGGAEQWGWILIHDFEPINTLMRINHTFPSEIQCKWDCRFAIQPASGRIARHD